MFRRRDDSSSDSLPAPTERITSVLGDGTTYHGRLTGRGGVRIEGAFEGEIALNGILVVGTTGRVTCEDLRANTVIVAGAVRGNITAEKVEIRSTGRVWGDVVTTAFSTEDGGFLRGQITMEEEMDLELAVEEEPVQEESPPEEPDEKKAPTPKKGKRAQKS
jgi:cytoskeletal protein CcmA (bactofilin family)